MKTSLKRRDRRGAVVILVAILLIVFMAMVSYSIDMGYIATVKTQLQSAADAAALAAAAEMNKSGLTAATATAERIGELNASSGGTIDVKTADVVYGTWNLTARTFTPAASGSGGNAVRVRITQNPNLFFARAIGIGSQQVNVESIAIATPRDIAFVVDLSGSMNDDTESAWATGTINTKFATSGYGSVGNTIMQDLYTDFNFGTYPGTQEQIGKPLGTWYNSYQQWAYAEMTKDTGPLAASTIPADYRILTTDTEATRKSKAYHWIIEYQIKRIMPNALPAPSAANYGFWAKYIDYLITQKSVNPPNPPSTGGGGSTSGGSTGGSTGGGTTGGTTTPPPPPPPSPPPIGWLDRGRAPALVNGNSTGVLESIRDRASLGSQPGLFSIFAAGAFSQTTQMGAPPTTRGSIPPGVDGQTRLIGKFNNPNTVTYPTATNPNSFRNLLGYRSYLNFILDHGRELKINGQFSPISLDSSLCPKHSESTKGGTFDFPPREQPTHACRRSMIAALNIIQTMNASNPSPEQRDWVSIVTFDKVSNAAQIRQSLTSDYVAAMRECTKLQAVGDRDRSTATEQGMIKGQDHIKAASQGGVGREFSDKVVVVLTDGAPNDWVTSSGTIDTHMASNPSSNFYGGGYYWLDAPIMQAGMMATKGWKTYPVGIGLGTDYDFMDRFARAGSTADKDGQSPRGSGNPAEYEERLEQIFKDIIANAGVRLVN